jgi:hypothetical protein
MNEEGAALSSGRENKGELRRETVANPIYITQEYAEAFEQRFRERAGLVDQMPGLFQTRFSARLTSLSDPAIT